MGETTRGGPTLRPHANSVWKATSEEKCKLAAGEGGLSLTMVGKLKHFVFSAAKITKAANSRGKFFFAQFCKLSNSFAIS